MMRSAAVIFLCLLSAASAAEPQRADPHDYSEFPIYVGQNVCLKCHTMESPEALSPLSGRRCRVDCLPEHNDAFKLLSSDKALAIAKISGEFHHPTESRICLSCHSAAVDEGPRWTAPTFHPADGVQCETCHGPGSAHVSAIRSFRKQNKMQAAALIRPGDYADCKVCHVQKPSHEEVLQKGFRLNPWDQLYKTPVGLAISPRGGRLYVVCQNSNSLIVVDTESRKVVGEVKVGLRPHAVAVSPDGKYVYVSNRMDGTLSVIEALAPSQVTEIAVGHEPHGVAVDPRTGRVFVANTGDNTLAIIEPDSVGVAKRLAGGGSPWGIAIDGMRQRAYVTNVRPRPSRFQDPPVSELTTVDLQTGMVHSRLAVSEANMLQGVAVLPDGTAIFSEVRTKNLAPTSRVGQGWVITNGMGIAWPDGSVDQVLLDDPGNSFADPFDVATSPDGRWAVVPGGGVNELAIVDMERLRQTIGSASPDERRDILPNHLGTSTEYVRARVRVGRNARAVVFGPEGEFAYVANALDDTISVVNVSNATVADTIDLGGPKGVTEIRLGERLFHDAAITYGKQFSCRSCHPDGHLNGLSFDIEADGAGMHPVDNRTLQGILDTAPFKWEGTNPSLHRQCGPRLSVFFTRLHPFAPEELDALVRYMTTIERPPNRYRGPEGLTLSERRGKAIFERATRNDGTALSLEERCSTCHNGAYKTSRQRNAVGTTMWLDSEVRVDLSEYMHAADDFGELGAYFFVDVGLAPKILDTPHLTNIADGAPYLHNGAARTLEEIWTRFNLTDRHGFTNDLTRQQFNDLIAYLKTQ